MIFGGKRTLPIKTFSDMPSDSDFIVSMNRVVAHVAGISGSSKSRIFLLTSTGVADGKSTLSVTLSELLAREGKKTLLISETKNLQRWNLESKSTYEDVLMGKEDMAHLSVSRPNLYVLGIAELYHIEVYDMERTKEFMERVRTIYELIIIDSPCIQGHPLPAFLSSYVDGVILVIGPDTAKSAVLSAKRKIAAGNGKLLGAICNQIKSPIPPLIGRRLNID